MFKMRIRTNTFGVEFDLHDYITWLEGNSGVGKTYLCNILKNYAFLGEYDKSFKDYKLGVADTFDLLCLYINKNEPYIIFVDKVEQWSFEERDLACNLIYKTGITDRLENDILPCYFVIIDRGIIGIPSDEKDFVKLEYKNNTFFFKPFKRGV